MKNSGLNFRKFPVTNWTSFSRISGKSTTLRGKPKFWKISSLCSKRFRGVWEQRKTKERDFVFFACALLKSLLLNRTETRATRATKSLTGNFPSNWFFSRNFRNFRINGLLFGNWPISQLSKNFSGEVSVPFVPVSKFPEFLVESEAYRLV